MKGKFTTNFTGETNALAYFAEIAPMGLADPLINRGEIVATV